MLLEVEDDEDTEVLQMSDDNGDVGAPAACAPIRAGPSRADRAAGGYATAGAGAAAAAVGDRERGWPKVVGETVVFAFATRSGFTGDLLTQGDSVTCRREEVAAAASVLKRQGSKKGKGKRKSPSPTEGGGGSAAGGRFPFAGKSKGKDLVVRFYNPAGREVGRLPAETSRWMAPLLDDGVLEVTGSCVDCPSPRIRTMDQILLQVCIQIP
jgi:hypothetical protein